LGSGGDDDGDGAKRLLRSQAAAAALNDGLSSSSVSTTGAVTTGSDSRAVADIQKVRGGMRTCVISETDEEGRFGALAL
jgi:hypothetical protein